MSLTDRLAPLYIFDEGGGSDSTWFEVDPLSNFHTHKVEDNITCPTDDVSQDPLHVSFRRKSQQWYGPLTDKNYLSIFNMYRIRLKREEKVPDVVFVLALVIHVFNILPPPPLP